MTEKVKKGGVLDFASPKKMHTKPSSGKSQKGKGIAFYKNYTFQVCMLWIALTFLLTLFIIPSLGMRISVLNVEDISARDIKAPWDFSVEDHETTIERRKEAERSVLPVYDYNDHLRAELISKVHSMFETMRTFHDEKSLVLAERDVNNMLPEAAKAIQGITAEQKKASDSEKDWAQEWSQFAQSQGIEIDYATYLIFEREGFSLALENEMTQIIYDVMKQGLIPSYSFSFNEQKSGFVKRNLGTQTESKVEDVNQILDLEGVRKHIALQINALVFEDKELLDTITTFLQTHITPNLTFNLSETRSRIDKARESIKPVFFQVKKGEMIIREGEKAKPDHVEKINALQKMKRKDRIIQTIFGLYFIIALTLLVIYTLLKGFKDRHIANFSNLLLVALNILMTVTFIRIGVFIAQSLPSTIQMIPSQSYYYALPFAAAGIIITILLDAQIAVMVSIVVALLAGILLNRDLGIFIVAFLGTLCGIYFLSSRKKTSVVKSGFIIALANIAAIISIDLFQGSLFSITGIFDLLFGFVGGLAVIALVLALTPIMEALFHVTTDVRLLELLNINQPLLRRLAMEAPGTYHHCIVAANLSEAACEAINANALLGRVAAYYHDIGKIKMPKYYIENQTNYKNEHENLSPSMSSLILISHLKDGVELAKKYKLNQPIIDIIQQHHGTSIIKYFYNKAREMNPKGAQEVKEEDYRYPGPKPQTKEAGIVMLADAVEATARTLSDPRPSRLQGMIQNIINNIFRDGQLDECELTLKDLHQIAGSFNMMLNGIFHPRIVYPSITGTEEGKKEKGGDSNQKQTKETKAGYAQAEDGSGEGIRRLGIQGPGSEHNIRK